MYVSRFLIAVAAVTLVIGTIDYWSSYGSAADEARPAATPATTAKSVAFTTKAPEENPFPLIVRIDKSALSRYVDDDYDELRPVDEMVLGAHAVGQSRTRGVSRAELLPDSKVAAFDIRFAGTTVSKTVSTQTPGVVYGRTLTHFVCKQRIEFDPRHGFVEAGAPTIEGNTELAYDGFGSTRRLGQRLIRRLAQRQAERLFEPARQIADRDNKRDTLKGFEDEVARNIQSANQGLDLVHYVDRFLGKEAKLQLFAKSSPDCIQIGFGPEGEQFAPMTALPAQSGPRAPIEVWAHYSLLGGPVLTLLDLASSTDELPGPLQTKISQALSLSSLTGDSSTKMELRDGWLVLSLPEDVMPPPEPADNVAHHPTTTAER